MPAIELLHVRYQVSDLAAHTRFLRDFGMTPVAQDDETIYLRGTGQAPFVYAATRGDSCRFLGAAFAVDSRAALERLAVFDGSGPLEPHDAPGGGWRVRMRMPDGFVVDAVHGFETAQPLPLPPPAPPFNDAKSKPRLNQSVRAGIDVAPVRRLGHFVLHVRDHDASVRWLQDRLGLLASDHLAVPDQPQQIIGSFLRIDAGARPVDHHCLLVLAADRPGVHHCSFEVEGLDAVMAAHDHLLARGYTLDCGVGRHLLGSQIFDYWRDPSGFRIEHYTDGDVVDHRHQPSVFAGTADQTTQWGAKPPKDFFE